MPASTPPPAIASTTASGWIDTARPITSGCSTWPSSCCTAMIKPSVISAIDPALGDQRHDHREETGDHRTDERDERAEEHQRRQRQRQRYTHDRQAGADADGVDERDQERRAHIADQRSEAGPAGVAHPLAHVLRKDLGDKPVDVAAAVQHEDQREQHQQRAGDDLGHGARRRQRPAGQLLLVVLQRLDGRLASRFDLLLIDVQRAVRQPVPHALDAGAHLLDECRCALDELADHEREDPADDSDAAEQHQGHRSAPRSAAPIQEVDDGQQQRGQHRRQGDGHHDQLELLDHPQQRDDRREDHQQPPRPRGRLADERSHRLIGDGIDGRARWHAGSVTAGRSIAANLANRPRRACCATISGLPAPLPYWRVPRRTGERRPQPGAARQGQILVAALGDHRRRGRRAGRRARAGVGSTGQGVEERLLGELVVGAGGGRRGDVVDAQLRARFSARCCRSAGVKVKQWRSEAAFYAGNALSTTLPGGPVLSATFIYRQQRIWGASPVVASWQLVMSGALQVVGLGAARAWAARSCSARAKTRCR